jgi:uncharacterized membrane protein
MRWLLRVFGIGFFTVLPVLLIYLLIGQLFDMMMSLTQPILDFLPDSSVLNFDAQLLAVILLLGLLLIVGLAALTGPGRALGEWLEQNLLSKLPLYDMFRNLASRFAGEKGVSHFTPALVKTWPNMRTFAFVVEEHADGNYTIFMPIAPTPSVGYVSVIAREDVELLDVPAQQALSAVLSWGDGAEAALRKASQPAANGGAE